MVMSMCVLGNLKPGRRRLPHDMYMQLGCIIAEQNEIPLKQLCRIVAKFLPQVSANISTRF